MPIDATISLNSKIALETGSAAAPLSQRSAPRWLVRSYALSLQRFSCFLGLLLFLASSPMNGQIQTQSFATPEVVTGLMQASDGNYYGVSGTGIYRITPLGVSTKIFTLGSAYIDGASPQPLVQGPDGALYGITQIGGPNACNSGNNSYQFQNCGVFYKINLDGSGHTVLHNFTTSEVGTGVLNGALVLADDGNFYGTGSGGQVNNGYHYGSVFRVSPSGSASLVYAFTDADDLSPIGSLIQSTDGFLYGITFKNRLAGSYPIAFDQDFGHIFKLTLSGQIAIAFFLPADGSMGLNFLETPVEGPDGTLYGGIGNGTRPNNYATVYAAPPSKALQLLYTFNSVDNMQDLNLVFGTDGNMYGTAYKALSGTQTCTADNYGCGNAFELTTAGTLTKLHTFTGGADGANPASRLLAASNGDILGTALNKGYGVGSVYDIGTALAPPVQLTFTVNGSSAPIVPAGAQLTLNWKVLNAFSLSMQQCFAFSPTQLTQQNAPITWTGKQTGTYTNGVFSGAATITAPGVTGSYVYALTCGGVESGQVTLTVGNGVQITTSALPNGSVSKPYALALQATGGTTPYTWGSVGNLPPGLTLDPNSGTLGGTPKQFGSYQVTVGVQDSANPPQTTSATFPLVIDSTLALTGSLNNAVVGTNYTGTLNASGGYGTYKFALASGALPDGITLNSTTGVLFGTPTKDGKSTFSVTLTDGENPAAKVTQPFTLSTQVPPLTVEPGQFQDCTVNVPCDQQFVALGGTPPYTWAPVRGEIFPYGLTLSSSGELTGKPLQHTISGPLGGPYSIQVNLTDSSVPPITVSGHNELIVNSGLAITPFALPTATTGVVYTSTPPMATGGLPPYTWTIVPSDSVVVKEFARLPDGSIYSPGPKTAGVFTLVYTLTDAESNPATATFSTTLTIVAPPRTTSTIVSSSSNATGTGSKVTFTASVSASGSIPTGLVVFYNGTSALGTASLDATGTASFTTAFSSPGTYNITAAYSGDASSTGSVSAPLVETVVTPSVSGSVSPGTLTLTSGQSGTLTITLTPSGGFTGAVSFSCGQLPAHVSCTFAPPSVTIVPGATSVTDTLTINTAAKNSAALAMPAGVNVVSIFAALTLWFPASMLALFGLRRKAAPLPRLLTLCLLTLSLAGTLTLSGCGSSSPNLMAAPGTYSIPVTLTLAGGTTQVVTATVIVK